MDDGREAMNGRHWEKERGEKDLHCHGFSPSAVSGIATHV
jgi:hypothetical protein